LSDISVIPEPGTNIEMNLILALNPTLDNPVNQADPPQEEQEED
jgi:hypothetical protein